MYIKLYTRISWMYEVLTLHDKSADITKTNTIIYFIKFPEMYFSYIMSIIRCVNNFLSNIGTDINV